MEPQHPKDSREIVQEEACDMEIDHLFDSREHDTRLNSSSADSPRTPKEPIFNPFASGPDRLLQAPFSRKFRTATRILSSPLTCKVTEHCETDAERIRENRLMDAVYDDLMGAILAQLAKEISVSDDGCKTPTSESLVNDVAETCPDAPARITGNLKYTGTVVSSKKKLNFGTAGLGRKLEF